MAHRIQGRVAPYIANLSVCRWSDRPELPAAPKLLKVRTPAGMALNLDTSETGNAAL